SVRQGDSVGVWVWPTGLLTAGGGGVWGAGGGADGAHRAPAAAREMEEETGWRPGPLRHLLTVEPSNGLTDARHHIYWSDEGAFVGQPQDDFESDRREWVSLKLVPDMVARGEVPAANMAAALLMLHHIRLG
ncbi:NUDIX domain-containing protein, partial [Streptomyces celluloflavus]